MHTILFPNGKVIVWLSTLKMASLCVMSATQRGNTPIIGCMATKEALSDCSIDGLEELEEKVIKLTF